MAEGESLKPVLKVWPQAACALGWDGGNWALITGLAFCDGCAMAGLERAAGRPRQAHAGPQGRHGGRLDHDPRVQCIFVAGLIMHNVRHAILFNEMRQAGCTERSGSQSSMGQSASQRGQRQWARATRFEQRATRDRRGRGRVRSRVLRSNMAAHVDVVAVSSDDGGASVGAGAGARASPVASPASLERAPPHDGASNDGRAARIRRRHVDVA